MAELPGVQVCDSGELRAGCQEDGMLMASDLQAGLQQNINIVVYTCQFDSAV